MWVVMGNRKNTVKVVASWSGSRYRVKNSVFKRDPQVKWLEELKT